MSKFILEHDIKAQMRSESINLLFL